MTNRQSRPRRIVAGILTLGFALINLALAAPGAAREWQEPQPAAAAPWVDKIGRAHV